MKSANFFEFCAYTRIMQFAIIGTYQYEESEADYVLFECRQHIYIVSGSIE